MPSLFSAPFYFLRHAESTTNAAGTIAGTFDAPLTPRGREQALTSIPILRGVGIAAIVSSPKQRAADTARPVAAALGLPVRYVERIAERNWGALEGRPISERESHFIQPPGAESWEQFVARTMAALDSIRDPAPVLIVAHSGTMRVLRSQLGIGDVYDPIGNALPVRMDPPEAAGVAWRMTVLGEEG